MFAVEMTLCIENPKVTTKKLLEFVSEFSKVAGYRMNIQKSVAFYTLTMSYQKEKLRKQFHLPSHQKGFPGGASQKESTCQCRIHKRHSFDLGSGRSPGVENGNSLQYSCLENSIEIGDWQATVHGATKNQT